MALDCIIIAVLIYAFVRGAMKGFVMELAGLVSVLLSLFVAKNFGDMLMGSILSLFGIEKEVSHIVSFVVIFLLAMLAIRFLAAIVTRLISWVMLGWLNKLLGGALSVAKWLIITSMLLYSFNRLNNYAHLFEEDELASSQLYRPLVALADSLLPKSEGDVMEEQGGETTQENSSIES